MFYETRHSVESDYYCIDKGENILFPPHIHRCFELFAVIDGEITVKSGDREKRLKKGEAALIFPNVIHSFKTHGHSKHIVCVFSGSLTSLFSSSHSDAVPQDPFFKPEPDCIKILSRICGSADLYSIKGLLYLFCSCFEKDASYVKRGRSYGEGLLIDLFNYIEENYQGECSLKSASLKLSYDYAYIAKYFKKAVGMTYNEYVNLCRTDLACRLLCENNLTVLETGLACGYNSLRSFDRNFKRLKGISPSDYRSSHAEKSCGCD